MLSVLDGPHPTCVGHDEGRSRSWCFYFLHGLLEGGFLSRSWPRDVSPISGSLGRKRKVPRKAMNFPQIVPEMLYRIQESVSSCSFLLPWSPLATFKKTWTMVSKGITEKEKTFELCPSRKKKQSRLDNGLGHLDISNPCLLYKNSPSWPKKQSRLY